MKHVLTLALLAWGTIAYAQDKPMKKDEVLRTITVTGSAEMEITPDEIIVAIGLKEYYLEEYEPKKEYKDYKNFVELPGIEAEFLKITEAQGIKKERLVVQRTGTDWMYEAGRSKLSKEFRISFKDFNEVDKLVKALQLKGLDFVRIQELKHKDLASYRLQVKANALKAAQSKAEHMLSAIDQKVGKVVSVQEVNDAAFYMDDQLISNNRIAQAPQAGNNQEFRKIKLRYEVNASFEIE